jgi:plasmid stabilization system protein ParE
VAPAALRTNLLAMPPPKPRVSGYILHPEAYTDLDEIWEFIAADSLDAADR